MCISIYVYGYKHLVYSFPGDAPDVHRQDSSFEHINVTLVISVILIDSWAKEHKLQV